MPSTRSDRATERRDRSRAAALAALACGGALGLAAGCSAEKCRDLQQSGSALASLVCGGEGTQAPEPPPVAPSACSDVRLVLPEFFKLLESSALDGLRAAIRDIGAPRCAIPRSELLCTEESGCRLGGDCVSGICPCTQWDNPLVELLQMSFRALASIATDPREPGATPPSACVSPEAARDLLPEQRNRLCEVRRALDVLLSNGGRQLLADPRLKQVALSFLHYLEGKSPAAGGTAHYDLFTTFGRMAQNPAICPTATLYVLLDRSLAYLTPQVATAQLGALQALLADPEIKLLLAQLGAGGSTPQGRASTKLIVHQLMTMLIAARDGAAALQPVDDLAAALIYGSSSYSDAFKQEVRAVLDQTGAMLAPQTGIFPALQAVLACMGNPRIDQDGELIGALYDVISAQEGASGGLDLSTLVGAVRTLLAMDATGQTTRALRLLLQGVGSASASDETNDPVRELLAQALTAEEGRKLLPALDAMVEHEVLGELANLLQDLLYGCKPP